MNPKSPFKMRSTRSSADTDGFDITPPFNDCDGLDETAGVRRFREMLEDTRSDALLIGRTLKQYQLLEQLGAGAMGSVYKARNTETDELVAVKILDANFVRQHDALQRFQKEARLLAETNSPFVTKLLDVCSVNDWHFLVAELVTGTNVAAFLKENGPLDESTALQIAADVAQALVDISGLEIIHRDVKPENILLGGLTKTNSRHTIRLDSVVVKLTDFGLARHTQQTQSMALTRANTVLGTPLYMSPEQFSDLDLLDARSDVYSLGATLFAMLTGQPPFPSNDTLQLAELHRHATPPDAKSLNPKLSDGISSIVAKCLQKRPDLRYETAAELLADLQRMQRCEPTSISIHPVIPSSAANDRQAFVFEWELMSSPAVLWPYVSNTERLNRAIGLPSVHYTTSVGQHGEAQIFANVRIAGMAMKWREHVFEWIEAQRMGVLREFESGPLRWFTSVVEFLPTVQGRTRLVHRFQVEGRGWFGKVFTKFKFGLETKRSLTKVYSRIDGMLTESHGAEPLADPFEPMTAMTKRQEQRLAERLAKVRSHGGDRETVLQFAEYVRSAPAQDVGRIRPLSLAQKLNLPFDHVFEVLLRGVKVGLFDLVWDVICPSCRITTQTCDVMKMVKDHEHCDACNLDFGVDLTHNVEAIFRVKSDIRRVDGGKYCIGGPAHSPHVVAQQRLVADETARLGLTLMAGDYCIRGPQLPFSLTFSVVTPAQATPAPEEPSTYSPASKLPVFSDADVNSLVKDDQKITQQSLLHLDLGSNSDWRRSNVCLTTGQQLIVVHNSFAHEVVVRIERAAPRSDVLTAAKAVTVPLFRELFPSQAFRPSQLAAVTKVTLLRTQLIFTESVESGVAESLAWPTLQLHLQRLSSLCGRFGGTWVKIVDKGALISFVSIDDALQCARQISGTVLTHESDVGVNIKTAITSGKVDVSVICGQIDYIGRPVEELSELLKTAQPGECVIGDNVAGR